MQVIIDRFEGNFAVVELENKERISMPKSLVPKGAKEGDIIDIVINEALTKKRREQMGNRLKDLWNKK